MTQYATKAALVADIVKQRSSLEKYLSGFSPDELIQPGRMGDWSIKDVLAHLVDWEQRFIGWYKAGARGETPETPAPGLNWRQLDILNERIYEQYKDTPLVEIQEKSSASYQQILELLEGIPEEELFTPNWYIWLNGERLVDWAAANTCNHYYWAKTQLQKGQRLHV